MIGQRLPSDLETIPNIQDLPTDSDDGSTNEQETGKDMSMSKNSESTQADSPTGLDLQTHPLNEPREGQVADQSPAGDSEQTQPQPLTPINYESLNGLRGIGAFCVSLSHWFPALYLGDQDPGRRLLNIKEPTPTFVWLFLKSPFSFILTGNLWVYVFFLLSGFVLPLRFFKTLKPDSISGGILRRYPRLMLPVMAVLSIIYTAVKLGLATKLTDN